jgi:signal transduction histidine kinase
MKKKVIASLVSLFLLFCVGAMVASWYVSYATDRLRYLVELHEVEGLRRDLVIGVQAVQADLYTTRTGLAPRLDSIVANVRAMDEAAAECGTCHHEQAVEEKLALIQQLREEYKTALSYYITIAANQDRISRLEFDAASVGNRILQQTERMSAAASAKLPQITGRAMSGIESVRIILLVTMVGATVVGIAISVYLVRSVTRPVQRLAEATRIIASGGLGHQIEEEADAEFGELSRHFNTMSAALRESYQQLESANVDLEEEATQRRQAEEAREALQAELLHSQKMEALGTLSAGIAHEFNNLLQVVRGCLDSVSRKTGEQGSDPREFGLIGEATERGAQLTQRLLTFSSKGETKQTPVDVNEKALNVKSILERTLPGGIEVQVLVAEDTPLVSADPSAMEQVLLNLALNARDAMPDGGVLRIETSHSEVPGSPSGDSSSGAGGNWVVIRVSDTGHGIDDGALPHIFEPFFTTKGVGKGTGLGLSTVYGIIAASGGQITCRSQPGEGTEFEVRLPALPSESAAIEVQSAPARRIRPGSGTILLVEDEQILLEMTSQGLEGHGYVVHTAASGEEAVEFFADRGREVDLVILDLGMPGMGGEVCLARLLEIRADAKILISSAYGSPAQEYALIESGAIGLLAKPYGMPDLVSKIERVLGA